MAEVTAFRHNALPYPIYGAPFAIVYPFYNTTALVTGATTPDAEISKNGDTFADCTNESVEIATTSGIYYLLLTGTELTCDIATIQAKSASAGMYTQVTTLYPRKLVTIRSGTSAGGSSTTITLDSGASAVDDFYNGMVCIATLDSVVEVRVIGDYVGSTKVATIEGPNWINAAPDTDDTFVIKLPEGAQMVNANVSAWLGTTVTAATAGVPDTNSIRLGNTVQTGRDVGASVLLSTGTGTGQLDFTSGVVKSNMVQILASAITGTAANIVGAFTKFFDKTSPTGTINSIPDAVAGATGGLFIAGTNAATTVTTALTTTFTGNLTGSVGSVTGAVGSVTGAVGSVTGAVGSVTALAANSVNASALATDAVTEIRSLASGTSDSGTTTTMVDAARTEADTDYWKGSIIVFTSGNLAGQARTITGFNAATDTITYSPPTTQAAATQTYEIWPAGNVWDEPTSAHAISGSTGAALAAAGTAADPWSTTIPGAYGSGTAGHRLGNIPDVAAGAAGGVFIAGTNAATTITTGLTTTFTGNLTGSVGSVTGAVGSVTGLTASNLDTTVSSRLAPTVAARTLDVSATGEAGIDWANIGAPTTSQTLSGTTVGTASAVTTVNGLAANTITAASMAADASTEIRSLASGTSDSGSTTTMVDAARTEADTDYWKGSIIAFTSGNILGQCRLITGFNAATDTITFTPATTQAVSTQNYEILPQGTVDISSILGSAVSTSTAQLGVNVVSATADSLNASALATDAVTEIANGVWSLDATGQQTQGTFGQAVGDPTTGTSLIARLPNATPGAAGGVFIAGTNAATTISTSFTTTFTGNLTGSVGSVTGAVGSVTGAVGSVTGLTASNLDATISSRLAPTTAGRTLDVTTTGEAGIDWANIGAPTTSQTLSGTTIGTATTVTGGATSAALTTAQADLDDIQTRLPAALVSGRMDSSVGAMASNTITAAAMASDASTEIRALASGTSDSGTTTTMVDAARTEADTDYWKGNLISFTSGNILGQCRLITGFNAATDTITFTPAVTQAVSTQNYEILPQGTVDSVVGSVGSVTGLTASNLDTTVSSRLAPTTSGRTLDVTTTGEAGIDWANIGAPTTSQTLSGTTVGTATAVTTVNGIAPNVVNASALATDAVTEIVNAVAALTGADPASVPAVNATWLAKLDWVCARFRNKETFNRSTGAWVFRNDADSGTIGSFTASDDGTTTTRPKAT